MEIQCKYNTMCQTSVQFLFLKQKKITWTKSIPCAELIPSVIVRPMLSFKVSESSWMYLLPKRGYCNVQQIIKSFQVLNLTKLISSYIFFNSYLTLNALRSCRLKLSPTSSVVPSSSSLPCWGRVFTCTLSWSSELSTSCTNRCSSIKKLPPPSSTLSKLVNIYEWRFGKVRLMF